MKTVLKIVLVIVVVGSYASRATETEKATIWALEESYWTYLKEGDLKSWNDQWHEQYAGWPYDTGQPIHRTDVLRLNEQVLSTLKDETLSFRLLPGEVVIIGDVAVSHYSFFWKATTKTGEKYTELEGLHIRGFAKVIIGRLSQG